MLFDSAEFSPPRVGDDPTGNDPTGASLAGSLPHGSHRCGSPLHGSQQPRSLVGLIAAAAALVTMFAGPGDSEAGVPDSGSRAYGGSPYYGREMYSRRYGPIAGPDLRHDYRYQGLGSYRDLRSQRDAGVAGSRYARPHYTGHGLYRRLYASPAGFGWGAYAGWGLGSYSPKYPYGPGHFYGHPYYDRHSYGRVFGRVWPGYPTYLNAGGDPDGAGFRFYGAEHLEPQHRRGRAHQPYRDSGSW
ncbi:MAG: hypothetical protein KDA79_19940 [Planctomycetaceae bacterium]|nr:hypothetical protein [Planctomycetaceae bacterium]